MPNATSNLPTPFCTILAQRGILAVTGDDRVTFLQGLISNDVTKATATNAVYAAYLTPQGKFLHDFFVLNSGDSLLLDCDRAEIDQLRNRLQLHKLRSKVTLTDQSDQWDIWAIWGGNAPKNTDASLFLDPRHEQAGWRGLFPKGEKPSFGDTRPFADYDRHRMRLGLPDGLRDMESGKSPLLEGNFDRINGISWDKGCYLGQELTARTRYRGLLKRRIFPVQLSSRLSSQIITHDGKDVGVMRSHDDVCGIALLDIAMAEQTDTKMMAGESIVTIIPDSKGDS